MIIFKKLHIQNFLSYGNAKTVIDLNCNTPTLITGVNYDASVNGELDSNGCGKSSILNALSYVLYNKTISINEKLDSLINNINRKDMLVILYFSKGKQNYRISRFRKNKSMGGEGVLIEQKNGKEWKDITSTKPEIQISDNILEIPYTVFNRIIGYAAGEEPFLKMGLPKQREVIDELFEYTELTKRAEKIKEVMKGLKKDLEYAMESNDNIKEEAARHKSQLSSMREKLERWEKDREETVEKLKITFHELSSIDFDSQKETLKQLEAKTSELKDLKNEIKNLYKDLSHAEEQTEKFLNFDKDNELNIIKAEDWLKEIEIKNFSKKEQFSLLDQKADVDSEIDNIKDKILNVKNSLTEKEQKVKKLEEELQHLDDEKCPYCLQKYSDAKKKINEVKSDIKKHKESMAELTHDIKEYQEKLNSLEQKSNSISDSLIFEDKQSAVSYIEKIEKVKDKIKNLKEFKNPYQDLSDDIEEYNSSIESKVESIETIELYIKELENDFVFDSTSDLLSAESKMESLEERIQERNKETNPYIELLESLEEYEPKESKDDEIKELENKIYHCDFLIKLLTKKDSYLRKALMDKYLPLLNKRLHHYLKLMALPHKVIFNSDLSTEISQFSQTIPYGNLSAGQRARINIALSLSFRDVLQSKHNFINLFMLDECLDVGLSNVGVRKTVKAIKEVAKTNKLSMFVISHRDEAKESFPETLEIELRNGFSTIKKATQ